MTKILLVEDDKSLREIYGVRLLAEGYDIVSAGDGEEALAMAIKERPALIVSDVMMPKISGFDMLDILRSTTETKDIKVIMMTALSSEDQRQRGEKLGADRYLVKSQVGIEDVVRTVHEVLGDLPGASNSQSHYSPQPTQSQNDQYGSPQFSHPPAASYTTQNASSGLPQPTAPFASQTIRPNGLGDRMIQPLQPDQSGSTADVAQMMEQELSGNNNGNNQNPGHHTAPEQQQAQPAQPTTGQRPENQYSRPDLAALSPPPSVVPAPRNPDNPQPPAQSMPSAPPNPQNFPQHPPMPPTN